MPVDLVVELDVVRKRVCIFPLFSYWQAGGRNYFLLNDLIRWLPCWEVPPLNAACTPARGSGCSDVWSRDCELSELMLLCETMWCMLKLCEVY